MQLGLVILKQRLTILYLYLSVITFRTAPIQIIYFVVFDVLLNCHITSALLYEAI